MAPYGEPYEVKCRRGCGKTVTLGVDEASGGWKPYDDYEANILHKCPLYKPSQGRSQGKTIQESREEMAPSEQDKKLDKIIASQDKILELQHTIMWALEKKLGINNKQEQGPNDDDDSGSLPIV